MALESDHNKQINLSTNNDYMTILTSRHATTASGHAAGEILAF
jgi:hypothetical protein